MNNSRTRSLQIVSIAGFAILLGLPSAWWLNEARTATVDRIGPTTDEPRLVARGMAQSTDPVEWKDELETAPLSITDTVYLADHIYEGMVTAVTTATFNTPTGSPPGGSNPIHDDYDADALWTLHRYAVVELTTHYTGPVTLTHMVLPVRGGTFDSDGDGQAEYIHDASGIDLVDVAISDRYLIYGVYPWTVPPAQVVGSEWEAKGLDLAIQMTAAGDPTSFIETYAGYKIQGSSASSITHRATHDLGWLRNLTQRLTN